MWAGDCGARGVGQRWGRRRRCGPTTDRPVRAPSPHILAIDVGRRPIASRHENPPRRRRRCRRRHRQDRGATRVLRAHRRERLRHRPSRTHASPGSPSEHGDDVAARFSAAQIDASDPDAVAAVAREHRATHVMNAVEPKFVPTIFAGRAGRRRRLPRHGHEPVGAASHRPVLEDRREARRRPVRAGRRLGGGRTPRPRRAWASSPGSSDVFARYAADNLFSDIDELGTRDGANLVVRDADGNEIFAPSFSHLDHDRGVPEPAGDLGEGCRLVHDRAVLASPRCSTSRRASARSSA